MRLEGRIAVVTGASRGIGLEVCRTFAAEGARVAMLARDIEALGRAADGIPDARAFACDVGEPASVEQAFTAVRAALGDVDILINNAALGDPCLMEEAADAELQRQVSVNLLGPIYCARAAIPMMRRRGIGDIINISSESVSTPYPMMGVYAATKSALETVSASLRSELRGSGIRVSVYRSGRVDTGFSDHWPAELRARIAQKAVECGFTAQSGERITPDIPAKAMLAMLLVDRSAHLEMMQLRGA
jgi:meso-butanediol dehydrogenase / (S,S)-butanediol dehydrogenase / diacetyl reductase